MCVARKKILHKSHIVSLWKQNEIRIFVNLLIVKAPIKRTWGSSERPVVAGDQNWAKSSSQNSQEVDGGNSRGWMGKFQRYSDDHLPQ